MIRIPSIAVQLIVAVVSLFLFSGSLFSQSKNFVFPRDGQKEFRGLALRTMHDGSRPKIGLVLTGGGGRGLAQIGVLKALEQYHIPIDVIVGNSLGSVIGGLYASGYSTSQLDSIAQSVNWPELLSFSEETQRRDLFVGQKQTEVEGSLVIRFDGLQPIIPSSFSGGQRLSNFFSYLSLQALYHPNPSFDDLKIPFRAIATDLISGRRLILDRGSLSEAMRASITVPLLYSPLAKDSALLVDGGLTRNIPVDVARSLGCDIVIVVNSTSPMRNASQLNAPWEIADQLMTIMMQEENKRQLDSADFVLTPSLGSRIVSDFTNVSEIISSGEQTARDNIVQLRSVLERAQRKSFSQPSAVAHQLLRDVMIIGNNPNDMPDANVLSDLSSLKGKPIDYDSIQCSLERMLANYRGRGYSLARIESVSVDPVSGVLAFNLHIGRIAQIMYEGNERTKDYVIRREFPLNEGDIFDVNKAYQGIVNINSMGLFEYVLLDVRYRNDEPIVVLKVKEKSSELLRLSLHADNEHEFVTTVDIRDADFRGAWEDLGLKMRYGFRDRLVQLDYTINRIFNSYLTFNAKGYFKSRDVITYADDPTLTTGQWDRLEEGRYKENKYGYSMTFGSHFERFGDITAEIRLENHKIAAISGQGYVPERYQFVGLKLQSIIDTEDKFSFPTTGMFFSFSYESAMKNLGSDVGFGKLTFTYENYFTFMPRHTFRPKIIFGFADATLPIAEQFSLGGFHSFYGLNEDDGRGRQLFLVNMEYRYSLPFKIIFDTYLKARYDLGTVSLEPQELKFISFRHGIGTEIDLDTPFGSAAFGFGKSFYFRNDLPETPVTVGPLLFYFSVGHSL